MPTDSTHAQNVAPAVTEVSERMTVLVREEIELAKVEMSQKVSSIARGSAAVGAGGVFGVFAVVFGLLTIAWVLDDYVFTPYVWPGFAVVFGLLLLLTIFSFLFAWRKFRVGAPTPAMAIDEARKIRETVAAGKPEDTL